MGTLCFPSWGLAVCDKRERRSFSGVGVPLLECVHTYVPLIQASDWLEDGQSASLTAAALRHRHTSHTFLGQVQTLS